MAIYLNANSDINGQEVTEGQTVIKMSQVTVASQPGMWNASLSAFVAPVDGVYRATGSAMIGAGNKYPSGVVMGFSINKKGPFETNISNVLVSEYCQITFPPIAQTVEALLALKKGDTVQLVFSGATRGKFGIGYSYFIIQSV